MTARWIDAAEMIEREIDEMPPPRLQVVSERDLIAEAYDAGFAEGAAQERARGEAEARIPPTPIPLPRPPVRETFGELLRFYRERRGFTRSQLGKAAGCDVSYMTRFELDARQAPRRGIVDALVSYLGLTSIERRKLLVAGGHAPVTEWTPALEQVAAWEEEQHG